MFIAAASLSCRRRRRFLGRAGLLLAVLLARVAGAVLERERELEVARLGGLELVVGLDLAGRVRDSLEVAEELAAAQVAVEGGELVELAGLGIALQRQAWRSRGRHVHLELLEPDRVLAGLCGSVDERPELVDLLGP